jgi:hypothetical protein
VPVLRTRAELGQQLEHVALGDEGARPYVGLGDRRLRRRDASAFIDDGGDPGETA